MADIQINYIAEPTLAKFHGSSAFVRGVCGPIGSGKSSAMCIEIISRATQQLSYNGARRSKWAVIRNTYAELKSTTIPTWEMWAPSEIAPITYDTPIISKLQMDMPDGTQVICEVLFISCDRPEDIKKLKSLELTGGWLNEVSELPKSVLDMLTGRINRYPPLALGGFNWSGIIMDTNAPDDDHWYYRMAEEIKPDGYEFFKQPGALIKEADGTYSPNPLAENIKNHQLGYNYWLRQIPGKDQQWINVYVLGLYGSVQDGKPVYSEYNDSLHCRDINPIQGLQLIIGRDYGLCPAAVITQVDVRGRLLILDEVIGEDIDERAFLENMLIPFLQREYPAYWAKKNTMIQLVGDPAGNQRSQNDSRSCFDEARAKDLKIKAAKTNGWLARRGAVAFYLNRLSGGQSMLIIDPYCKMLRKGFNGAYKYERIRSSGDERFRDEPLKNMSSHCHDALQYAALETGGIQAIRSKDQDLGPKLKSFRPSDRTMGMLG